MKTILKFISLIFLPYQLFGQGWAQGKNNGYIKLSQNFISSSNYYAPDGSQVKITTISQFNTGIYGELGLSKHLTGLINLPILVHQRLNDIKYRQSGKTIPGDQLSGVGDADIGVKFSFSQNKSIVLSSSLWFGMPLGKTFGGKTGILQTGDGEFNQFLRIDASHSFYPKPIYISAYGGFNNRTKDFSDELRYGLEIGYSFKKFTPILKINGITSLQNGPAFTSQGSLFANNVEFLSPALDFNYLLKSKFGLNASVASAFYGKNVLSALNYNFGAFLKW
ncbi:hypothetical protein N9R54_05420 [Pelobium sp.]|nr:hypothetical protein [Pelobium sp.]MDA9555659.1 hypothetical protein [Pelobium sp.]